VPAPWWQVRSSSPIRRTCTTYSSRALGQTLAKACGQLAGLSARLEGGKAKKDRAGSKLRCEDPRPRWLNRVISFELTGDSPAGYRLVSASSQGRKALEAELFGKRLLFTDRQLVIAEVVAAYRSHRGSRRTSDR